MIDFQKIPVTPVRDENGNWLMVSVALPGRNVYARIWKTEVGRTPLYLLDTDFEDNAQEDRSITHQLYGGDWENRLKQEMLLGIGGIRALRLLGIEADVYHCNEGHAAFIGLERMREYVTEENLSLKRPGKWYVLLHSLRRIRLYLQDTIPSPKKCYVLISCITRTG